MGTVARVIAALLLLFLGGCEDNGLWFASTQMDIAQYRGKTVVLLPVTTAPGITVSEEIKQGLQADLSEGLKSVWVRVGRPTVVTEEVSQRAGIDAQFPWTPNRLAAAANTLNPILKPDVQSSEEGIQGALGISITSFQDATDKRGASLGILVVFADANDPKAKRWALAGQWFGKTPADIIKDLGLNSATMLQSLRYWARDHFTLWGARDYYDPDQPFLEIAGPKGWYKSDSKREENFLQVDVTAIHDEGVREVTLVNDEANFTTTVHYSRNDTSGHRHDPIFVEFPALVPLVYGHNTITVVAWSRETTRTIRTLKIVRTTPPGLYSLAIGVSDYQNERDLSGAREGATAVQRSASTWNTKHSIGSEDQTDSPTEMRVQHELTELQQSAALDDPVLFYFAGRAVVVPQSGGESGTFLELSDAPAGAPGLASIDVKQLRFLLSTRPGIAVLDVCAERSRTESLSQALKGSLPDRAVIHVSECKQGVGAVGQSVSQWLLAQNAQMVPATGELRTWLLEKCSECVAGESPVVPATGNFSEPW